MGSGIATPLRDFLGQRTPNVVVTYDEHPPVELQAAPVDVLDRFLHDAQLEAAVFAIPKIDRGGVLHTSIQLTECLGRNGGKA